jgi:hypothetical protein
LTAPNASADRLDALLLDYHAAGAFVAELSSSVVRIAVEPRKDPLVTIVGDPARLGTAVAIAGPAGPVLVASGALAQDAQSIDVRTPSGRWIRCSGGVLLGDGALRRLDCTDPWLWVELKPLPLSQKTAGLSVPVFTVAGQGTAHPSLHRGLIAEVLPRPLHGVVIVDLAAPWGAPMLSADGHVLAVSFRPHPKDRRLSMAVTAETLSAWLRSEGPPQHP